MAACVFHGVEQVEGAGDIGLVVPQGLLSGLAHSLKTSKVDHGIGLDQVEKLLHLGQVQ